MLSRRPGRVRIAAEFILFLIAAGLFAATIVEPEWIEALTGLEPDEGSGSLEAAITIATGLVAVALAMLSGYDIRRRIAAPA
jgi:hypothetical protein